MPPRVFGGKNTSLAGPWRSASTGRVLARLVTSQNPASKQARQSLPAKGAGPMHSASPAPSTLILAGDYNSSLVTQPRLVGPAATSPSEPRPDEPELSNFLGQHRLVALNTWQPLSPHTFVQGKACTQIDFILTREISAGRQAKQASPVLDFPLGSWKKGGHRPVLASVTPVRHWNLPCPQVSEAASA